MYYTIYIRFYNLLQILYNVRYTYVFNLHRLFLTHHCLAVYQSKMLTEQEIEHILFNLVTCSLHKKYCTYIQYKIIHLKILESHSCSRLPLGSRPVSWKARSESTLSRFRADAKPSKARCRRTLNNCGPPPAPPPEGPFVPSISL